MFALCACKTSERSQGPACWLMYADCARSVGSWSAWTSLMRPPGDDDSHLHVTEAIGKSDPVKLPLSATGEGEGREVGAAEGETEGEAVAVGDGDGLAGLPGPWVGEAGESALS